MALSCARASPCFLSFWLHRVSRFLVLACLALLHHGSHDDPSGCQTHGNRGLQGGQSGPVSGDLRHLILRRVSHALSRVSAPVCVCPMTGICMAYALGKAEGKGGNFHWHVSAVIMRKLWTCLCGKAARSLRRSSIDWEYTF
ncbi:N-acetyltransferase complex ARD1 subunit [Trypanosoma cruzi]|nr:N-acetyltransferase complex ARD1 subunit [Trypanosoma cruzi cruzi]RNE96461.1 N-acetyltransferase complex ARD1 subunit [Trypanosoma cruzi]